MAQADQPARTASTTARTAAAAASAAAPSAAAPVDLGAAQWAPFLRTDRYGTYGSLPQPVLERLRLGLASLTLVPFRVVAALVCITGLSLSTRACYLLPKGSRLRARCVAFWCRFWAGLCCVCLGFRRTWVTVTPTAADKARGHGSLPAAGIISNHVSWADILITEAQLNASFVAKDGSQNIPLLGIVNRETQCIYVVRDAARTPGAAGAGVAASIKARMLRKAADPAINERLVLTFPEGTCTNGRYLLPFKTGAFLAGAPLLPVLMVWDQKDRRKVSVAWDTIDFPWHFFLCLCQPLQHVTCYQLPVYVPDAAEQKDPALYAKNVRDYMLRYCDLTPSDSTYEVKKVLDALPRSLFNRQKRSA